MISSHRLSVLKLLTTFIFAIQLAGSSAALGQDSAGAPPAPPAAEARRTVVLKVMTINLRNASDFWLERFPLIADEIVRLSPDLIGLQEVMIGMDQSKVLLDLIAERSGPDGLKYQKHERLKSGTAMIRGEGVSIFTRLPIEKKSHVDLPPERVAVFTRVKVAEGLTVDMHNTHLHNLGGDETRLGQARILMDFMNKNDAGFITFLTGDMNSHFNSQVIRHFLDNSLADTYLALHGDQTPVIGNTSPVTLSKENAPQNFRNRIDFVFMKVPAGWEDRVKILDSEVCFKNADSRGLYPSDHLGVMTTVEVTY